MIKDWYKTNPGHAMAGIDIVRIGVALIIVMHPLHGFAHPGNITGFGGYLTSLGYPFGLQLAWVVLLLQTLCSVCLVANRWVIPACLGHICVVTFGLVHFHWPNGWYVVGPGEGGMEWAVILLVCLVGVLWAYWPRKTAA